MLHERILLLKERGANTALVGDLLQEHKALKAAIEKEVAGRMVAH